MRVTAMTITNTVLNMELDLNSYLEGPVSSAICRMQNNADPGEVLRDYLPNGYADMKDDELVEVLEEACLYAAGYGAHEVPAYVKPVAVKVSSEDLTLFKLKFFPLKGMRVVRTEKPLQAA